MTQHDDHQLRPHALYRFYNADRALLYVGITLNPGTRWRDHASDKPWWTDVATITVETHPTRDAVLQAERRAITTEHPRHNVVHNRGHLPGTARTITAVATDMPDDCHDRCVPAGHEALYYPHKWRQGRAHYQCTRGHVWTCWWGHDDSGDAPEHRANPAEVYS